MPETLVTIAYLAAGLLFIFSLAGLSRQESASRGNLFGMLGMLIAVLVTAFGPRVESYSVMTGALLIGGAIGALMAARVGMTAMPQLVAILHSFVGAAAVLVGIATAMNHTQVLGGAEARILEIEIFIGVRRSWRTPSTYTCAPDGSEIKSRDRPCVIGSTRWAL